MIRGLRSQTTIMDDSFFNFESIIQKLIDDKHCSFCINAQERPYYMMGMDAGNVVFCPIFNQTQIDYNCGSQCLFYQLNEEKVKKVKG